MVDSTQLESPYEQLIKRRDFQNDLFQNIKSVKQVCNSLTEEIKAFNLAKTPQKKAEHKGKFMKKRIEVEEMFAAVKEMSMQIGHELA